MINGSTHKRLLGLAAIAVLTAACTTGGGATTAPSAAAERRGAERRGELRGPVRGRSSTTIGYSNGGGVGNGFREEQVCTAKAEALASGQVSKLTQIHRNTDAAGQLQDLRDLIAADVDAIVFNPNDPDALDPALDEAKAAGIKTISVDAFVNHADTYNLYNNQIEYAKLGAKWLFEQDRWQGQGLLHARLRRPSGRYGPPHRLQGGPRGLSGHRAPARP